MESIFQLEFFDLKGVFLRSSHRVFSTGESANEYGLRVLDTDKRVASFKLCLLILD